jgi:hypothetical protein
MPAVTRTRKLRGRAGIAVVLLIFFGAKLAPGGAEKLELNGQGIDTFTETLPAGVPFAFDHVVVANDGDEPLTLLGAAPVAMSPGMRVVDVTGAAGTRLAPGERARIGFSLEMLRGGPHTFQAVDVTYEQGGERHTQTMAYKLVACPAPAASCEIPSDWDE